MSDIDLIELPAATSVGLGPGDDDAIRIAQQVRDALASRCGTAHSHELLVPQWFYEAIQADMRIVYWLTFAVGSDQAVVESTCGSRTARITVIPACEGGEIEAPPKGLFARLVEAARREVSA